MQKLIDGLVKFRKGDFEAHRDVFDSKERGGTC